MPIRPIQLAVAGADLLLAPAGATSADQTTIRGRNTPAARLPSDGHPKAVNTALRRPVGWYRCSGLGENSVTVIRRVFVALLPLFALASCIPTPPPAVVVYGDSLTVQSEAAAHFFYPGVNVVWRAYGGTAICDWVRQAAVDQAVLHPTRVVLAFTGNTATCVAAAYRSGGDPAATAVYEHSLRQMRAVYPKAEISILIPPAMIKSVWFPYNGNPTLVAMYKRVGPELHMTINTAADDGLTPGHVFTWYRPQFPNGPLVVVRTPEGVHLTPAGMAWYGVALLKH